MCKDFNVRQNDVESWLRFEELNNERKYDEFNDCYCVGGADLSSTTDLTAFVLVFPPTADDDRYYVLPYFWLPEETIDLRTRRDHVPYAEWKQAGILNVTEGNVVDYSYIEDFICRLGERYRIQGIAFDRWNATQLTQNLANEDFEMIQFGQGFYSMSAPTKELEKLILEKKLAHNGHKILDWNMDNIVVRRDPAGNIKIDKAKSTEKVDGAVALVMALSRALLHSEQATSVYETRGLLYI